MIKQVIDGKTYNTETARCLVTVELMGYRMDERGRFTTTTPKKVGTTSLYENRSGAYFLVRDYTPDAGFYAEPDLVGQFRIHDRGHPAARATDAQARHREVRCRSRCIDQHLAHAMCRARHRVRT